MAAESSLIINGVDIASMSDEELFEKLAEYGVAVGPITEATRKVYQRKLAFQMGGEVHNYSQNEDVAEDEAQDVEPTQAYIDMLATGEKKTRQRRRPLEMPLAESSTYSTGECTEDYTEGDMSAADDGTPQAAYLSSSSPYASRAEGSEQQQEKRGGGGVVLLVLLVLVAAMVGCGLLFGGEQDAFDSLETLAKEALRDDEEL